MDLWYHLLVGILIQASFQDLFPGLQSDLPIIFWLLVLITCFFSHFIVDWGSYLTFHPDENYSKNHPNDKFYIFRNSFSGVISAIVLIYFLFLNPPIYFWAMLFAWLVDLIDWHIVRPLIKLGKLDEKYSHSGILHEQINRFREKVAFWLPNWREKKAAYVMDFVLALPIVLALICLNAF